MEDGVVEAKSNPRSLFHENPSSCFQGSKGTGLGFKHWVEHRIMLTCLSDFVNFSRVFRSPAGTATDT
jgi:hypothetical protein